MSTDCSSAANALVVRIGGLSQRELAAENDYLRAENKVLRGKFGTRVPLTEYDRRILVRFGMRIRQRLVGVVSVVKPETLLAWNRRMKREKWTYDNAPKRPGRPRKGRDTEHLAVRLAEENGSWGYTRIAGELKKLGHKASPSYVRDILKKHGIPVPPKNSIRGQIRDSFGLREVPFDWRLGMSRAERVGLTGRNRPHEAGLTCDVEKIQVQR